MFNKAQRNDGTLAFLAIPCHLLISYFLCPIFLFPFFPSIFLRLCFFSPPFAFSVLLPSSSHSSFLVFLSPFTPFLLSFNPYYFPLSCLLLTCVPSFFIFWRLKEFKICLYWKSYLTIAANGATSLLLGSNYLHKHRTAILIL